MPWQNYVLQGRLFTATGFDISEKSRRLKTVVIMQVTVEVKCGFDQFMTAELASRSRPHLRYYKLLFARLEYCKTL